MICITSAKTRNRPALARRTASNDGIIPYSSEENDTIIQCGFPVEFELERKFRPKHAASLVLSDSLLRLGYAPRALRVRECGTQLSFAHAVDDNGEISPAAKLHDANFCRDRLCPMCSWRRSYKIYAQVSRVMDLIQSDYKFLFLTLTVPNCSPEDLPKTLDAMFRAWSCLIRRKRFKASVRGFFRALEITRNSTTGFYHPHFHCVLAVCHSYFQGHYFIDHDEWLQLWRDSMKDQSITQVDIRRARNKRGDDSSLASAVAEIAKYSVKSSDYLYPDDNRLTDQIVSVLGPVLRGRRLCHMGGVFADAQKALKLDDAEDGDLVHLDGELRADVSYMITRYNWSAGCYKLSGIELLESDGIKE